MKRSFEEVNLINIQNLIELGPRQLQSTVQDGAVCSQTDPESFFPEKGDAGKDYRNVCNNSCEVTEECLALSLLNKEESGLWGGQSANSRKIIAKQIKGLF